MSAYVLTAVMSYLLGSIPFGYLLVHLFRGQDIRETGSGNIGATNVARSSPVLGLLTLVLDASKGMAAVAITRALYPTQPILVGLAGFCAVVGHVFPRVAEISRRQGSGHWFRRHFSWWRPKPSQ